MLSMSVRGLADMPPSAPSSTVRKRADAGPPADSTNRRWVIGSPTASSGRSAIALLDTTAPTGSREVTNSSCPPGVVTVACEPITAGAAGRLSHRRLKRPAVAVSARS